MAETWIEAQELCRQRADVYRLFASLFDREVTAETAEKIAGLKESSVQGDMSDTGERMIASGFTGMAEALEGFDSEIETELAVDYARVFLNAGKYEGQAAIPYESYYTSEEHLLMQDARDEVRAWYRENDVMPPHHSSGFTGDTPDDYVSFELGFMAILNDRIADALAAGRLSEALEDARRAKEFLPAHISNWSDDFTRDIVEVSSTKFYRYLAKAYRGFLMCETDDTAALVEYLQGEDAPVAVEASAEEGQ
jgi:TorA maturation chaperone TorD